MGHPRRANRKPHDHARKVIAERKKAARVRHAEARGLANFIERLR